MRWNLDKRYLAQLEAAGVAVVPTTYRTASDEVARDLAAFPAGARVVLKPAVSAGARDTGLFAADDPAALALAERVVDAGGVVMLQPEVAELSSGHEKALYLVDGALTHAIAKGALLAPGGGLIGGVYQENPQAVPTTPAEEAFARRALAAVSEVTGLDVPLYARVDLVDSAAHGMVLLEAELFEPALNLHVAPHVTDVVAAAGARRPARPGDDATGVISRKCETMADVALQTFSRDPRPVRPFDARPTREAHASTRCRAPGTTAMTARRRLVE